MTSPDTQYRYTSGRMLHLYNCPHFDDEPPREATPDEIQRLRVCSDCEGRIGGARDAPSPSPRYFVCPQCHQQRPISQRQASGNCIDCG